ncbi:MAG: UDP-N-acetylglucosamine 1-carboxyvinyltransferase [Lactobacillales bacterium]|jgi:UDP-N-acetylglucosamine 1-carboxyvinyltransferase|nr:UDP-N-acetylglucosamine 1-carboxyvinyltransferase [Lactobacillales bacterium]
MTKKIVINGGKKLSGEVSISGAKNSAVALIPATIMADSTVILEDVPDISDVHSLIEIIREMGAVVTFEDGTLTVDPANVFAKKMPTGKIQSLRASYYFMGALLGKFGEAVVGLPGGCHLGPRPIDLHIKGFEALGAQVETINGAVHLESKNERLLATRIFMDTVSVGATINVILAAVRAQGVTVIENAAREPEIIDVATLLNNMGAKIRGVGTNVIRIQGVDELHGCRHSVIPDRIEAGTYISIAAAVGENITIKNVITDHIDSFISKLDEMGVDITIGEDWVRINKTDFTQLEPSKIKTFAYPGFATDLQQPITPLLLMANGTSEIIDTIYPGRINHIPELVRMGAKASVEGDVILVQGPSKLTGAEVAASDLRAGACLVIAGLMAEGETKITNIEYILRGYSDIINTLNSLGADVRLIEE